MAKYKNERNKELVARVRKALRRLDKKTFMAKHNYSCCSTCSIMKAREAVRMSRQKSDGFVFTHQQDTAKIVERTDDASMHIRFALLVPYASESASMAKTAARAMSALSEAGLVVSWTGDSNDTIQARLP